MPGLRAQRLRCGQRCARCSGTSAPVAQRAAHPCFEPPAAQLKDSFESDRFGRKVVVHAASRQVAAAAITALLFQLDLLSPRRTPLHESEWKYHGATVGCQGGLLIGRGMA